MDILNRDNLEQLSKQEDGLHVSIYMPTHPAGDQIQQDPIRLKNLLNQAQEELMARGLRRPDAEALLQPAVRRDQALPGRDVDLQDHEVVRRRPCHIAVHVRDRRFATVEEHTADA